MTSITTARRTEEQPNYRLDHLALRVSSFDRSMPYYDALLPLLGFEKQREHAWSDGNGLFLQFDEAEPGARDYDRYGAGVNHIGFCAASLSHVEAIRDGMRAAGFEAPEMQLLSGASALFMKDPDGLRFEITYDPEAV
jgi:lactoylglutathione lyase